MFKTELHCHTAELSGCASESAVDTVRRYAEFGYDSVVFTNHFNSWSFRDTGIATYEDYLKRHFELVSETAESTKTELNLIPGLELALNSSANDYLIFGPYFDVMMSMPNIFDERLEVIHEKLNEAGCLIIQAHPLRFGMQIMRPEYLDGYEIINTHPNHNSHNDIVPLLAKSIGGEGKIFTAGSDHHDPENIPRGGIFTDEPVTDAVQLVDILRSGRYHIFGTYGTR